MSCQRCSLNSWHGRSGHGKATGKGALILRRHQLRLCPLIDYTKWDHIGDNDDDDDDDDAEDDEEEQQFSAEIEDEYTHEEACEEEIEEHWFPDDNDEEEEDNDQMESSNGQNRHLIVGNFTTAGMEFVHSFAAVKAKLVEQGRPIACLEEVERRQREQQQQYTGMIHPLEEAEFTDEGVASLRALIQRWKSDLLQSLDSLMVDPGEYVEEGPSWLNSQDNNKHNRTHISGGICGCGLRHCKRRMYRGMRTQSRAHF